MRFLLYMGHPAHFHLFKNVIHRLRAGGHACDILIKQKDILESLLVDSGLPYVNILPEGRKDHKVGIALGLAKRDWKMLAFVRKQRPDLMIGTSTEISHVGRLTGIPSIVVNEDDAEAVPLFSKLGYPWATHILAPECCSVGKWGEKKIGYRGNHELAYLHPDYFAPDPELVSQYVSLDRPFYILRFAKLTAHHDTGRGGITTDIAEALVERLAKHGSVLITAERELEPQFEPYRIQLPPQHIHHALALASMYIGDSQTMAAEAAVLGTPSIRFNDFVGELRYLEELEHRYNLTVGIRTDGPDRLLGVVDSWLADDSLKETFRQRRERFLAETIDVTAFFETLFAGYPDNLAEMEAREEPARP